MCVASKYLNHLDQMIKGINNDIDTLEKKQSEYDKRLAEHYHKVENNKFNACEGFYLAKQLQEILRKRRVIKNELARLKTIRTTINLNGMGESVVKAKKQVNKQKVKAASFQSEWNCTYKLEELIH